MLLLALLALQPLKSQPTREFTLSGLYQGENLFIRNPFVAADSAYCIQGLYLNDERLSQPLHVSALMVDLERFSVNERVKLRIVYKADCRPRILNPQVLGEVYTLVFEKAQASESKILWKVRGETKGFIYVVQAMKYGNWTRIGEPIQGKAKSPTQTQTYVAQPQHHSGQNRYRIRAFKPDGKEKFSKVFTYRNPQPVVQLQSESVVDTLTLSRPEPYKIFDSGGSQMAQGQNRRKIDISWMPDGAYTIRIDGRERRFYKQ